MMTFGQLFRCAFVSASALALVQTPALHAQTADAGSEFDLLFWKSVSDNMTAEKLAAYLRQFPNGIFADLARLKLQEYQAQAGSAANPTVAVPPPPPPQPAPAPMQAPAPAPAQVPAPIAAPTPAPAPQAQPFPVSPAPKAQTPTPFPASPAQNTPTPATTLSAQVRTASPDQTPVMTSSATRTFAPAPAAPPAPPPTAPAPTVPTSAAAPAPASNTVLAELMSATRNASAAPGVPLPAQPDLAIVPPVNLPAAFCSALERNNFHDRVYRPARDVANANNETAIAYLEQLKGVYDRYKQAGDIDNSNIVADAAKAYEPTAAQAYNVSVQYDQLFDRLMAVSLVPCAGS